MHGNEAVSVFYFVLDVFVIPTEVFASAKVAEFRGFVQRNGIRGKNTHHRHPARLGNVDKVINGE